jgi:hypothetical protein
LEDGLATSVRVLAVRLAGVVARDHHHHGAVGCDEPLPGLFRREHRRVAAEQGPAPADAVPIHPSMGHQDHVPPGVRVDHVVGPFDR